MLIYTSKSPGYGKQKPHQYNLAHAQYSLFRNAESLGIDTKALHYIFPLWEGAGNPQNIFGVFAGAGVPTWGNRGLIFNSTDLMRDADSIAGPINEIYGTIFAIYKTPATGTARPFDICDKTVLNKYIALDADVGIDFSFWFRDGGTQKIETTSPVPQANTTYAHFGVIGASNRHKQYVDGVLIGQDLTTTYSNQGTYNDWGIGGLYRSFNDIIYSTCAVNYCGYINQPLNEQQVTQLSETPYLLLQPVSPTFYSIPASNLPRITYPTEGLTGVSTTPTVQWSAVAGASSYKLQVDTAATFDSSAGSPLIEEIVTAPATSKQVTLSAGTTYHARVAAEVL